MLSIQAVRGLPRLRAPGIVPCIISFSLSGLSVGFLLQWPLAAWWRGMTKYRKGPQRSITQDHRGSAIMRKLPHLQQFCLIFKNYFVNFFVIWYFFVFFLLIFEF